MIFSKNSRKAPHLLSLLVAFAVAVGMWYVVSVRDRLEVQLEVGIEYNGIPSGLVVTDGLVSKVQVRLRGPEILLRSINGRAYHPRRRNSAQTMAVATATFNDSEVSTPCG